MAAVTTGQDVSLSPEGHDPSSTVRVPITGRLRRFLVWYGLATFGLWVSIGAVNAVLLPLQLTAIDPVDRSANLAWATGLGALAGMIAQPVAGLLSDRTRSPRGPRARWILTGAGGAAVCLLAIGGVSSLVGLIGAYVLLMLALNVAMGPKLAMMPDRVPRGVRGTFSAVSGLGILTGVLGGQVVAAELAPSASLVRAGLAAVVMLTCAGLVLRNPDHDNRQATRPPLAWRSLLRTFWVSPRDHPDVAYGFLGRLLTLTGFYLVNTFQLFILEDYIGLGEGALEVVPVMSLIALAATLVATVVGGPLSDRWGRRKPLAVIAGLIVAASLAVLWAVPTVAGFACYAVIAGAGFGLYLAVDQALLSEVLPSAAENGRYLGVLNIAVALPSAAAAAITGTIVATLGYDAIFPVGIATVGSLAIVPIRSVR